MANKKDPWSLILLAIGVSLFYFFQKPSLEKILKILILSLIGLTWDFILFKAKLLNFQESFPLGMISIWLLFCSVLDIYIKMFIHKKYIGATITAIFAPLSYLAAEKLSALSMANVYTVFILSVFWFFYFLLCYQMLSSLKEKNNGN